MQEVALWLHYEKSVDDDDTIAAAVGLIKYSIKKLDHLIEVAGVPPNSEVFQRKLKDEGIPRIVSDMLDNNYVAV